MPQIDRVRPNEDLPKSVDVAIIGGGIAGIGLALDLAERGLKVAVFEKGEIAAEQSSRNWGWCRQMGRDVREIPLILESLKLWSGMNQRLGAETGFRTCGIAYLEKDEASLAPREAWLSDVAAPAGIVSHMVRGADLEKIVPGSSSHFHGALYTPGDGKAEPFIAVTAMARAVQAKGGLIFTQCAVRGIETSAGRISSIVTERGAVACSAAVIAGGYWSRHFLANLSIAFPQVGVLSSVLRTTPLENGHVTTFAGGKFAARKRLDGGFTIAPNFLSMPEMVPASFRYLFDFLPMLRQEWACLRPRLSSWFFEEARMKKRWNLDETSPFESHRILNPKPVGWVLDEAMRELKRYFPAFAPVQVAERWAGMIDGTPDAIPVISAIDKVPGLYLSAGYSGHGFGIGPGAAKLMAQLIVGERPMPTRRLSAFRASAMAQNIAPQRAFDQAAISLA
ncbi:NAD(P)/FAD-dependent oxidoreductase [Aestuariivirga litoralis]|uniref:NAD(P)/FAD-dependent oxidoreductase n=1 Tax=Aestuariivirga litoralis TaxID=2650924 RepID=UPI003D7C2F8C